MLSYLLCPKVVRGMWWGRTIPHCRFVCTTTTTALTHVATPPYTGAKVLVGMSGGVDSSVSARLLQYAGWTAVGLFLRSWDRMEEGGGACSADEDYRDAEDACNQLRMDLVEANCVREYWEDVFTVFLKETVSGLTPSPDLLCNRYVKFTTFAKKATEIGAVTYASGHYARLCKQNDNKEVQLLCGVDPVKDQTYFLAAVPGALFQNALFPVGSLLKSEVRDLARREGLRSAERRESYGICFVGKKRSFAEFVLEYLPSQPGPITSVDGKTIGQHKGAFLYTIGQGAKVGGQTQRMFVCGKDMQRNAVIVCPGSDHPALFVDTMALHRLFWIAGVAPQILILGHWMRLQCRTRHGDKLQTCTVRLNTTTEEAVVHVDCPIRGVAAGQACVLYDGEVCLGGGWIKR